MKKYCELKKLKNLNNVAIVVHLDPDTDALCSAAVMRSFLLSTFKVKNVDVFTDYKVLPENYLPIIDGVELNPEQKKYEAVVTLDTSSIDLMGKWGELFKSVNLKVNIDHHLTNNKHGDINYVEVTSSACEVVFNVLEEYHYKFSKADYGKIYGGLITDTNNFSVGAITENTFRVASKCVKHINVGKIYNNFFENNSLINMKMLALSVKNLKSFDDGKIFISHITFEENNLYCAQPEDYLGVVNKLQTIIGCKFVCFIYPKGDNYYASMRCKNSYNVCEVAKVFGGGGHKCAAAFIATKPVEETIADLLPLFEKQLQETNDETESVF